MKPHFPTAVIQVYGPNNISRLNSILMLCDCVGERLKYKLKSPASAPKYLSVLFIRKNDSLGELGHRLFLAFFGGRLGLLHLRDCWGAVVGGDHNPL